MIFDLDNMRVSKEINDITMLYNHLMDGYTSYMADTPSTLNEDGRFMELYAPGYDNNGVAEITAKCL